MKRDIPTMAARRSVNQGMKQGVKTKRRGQALVEMALVMMILMMLSLGIVQFGIIYSTTIQLTNLAREGARFGAIHGVESNVEAQVEQYVRSNARGTTIPQADLTDANISVVTPTKVAGQPITVTIVYDMRKKFFVPQMPLGFLSDNNFRWSRFSQQATMTIE